MFQHALFLYLIIWVINGFGFFFTHLVDLIIWVINGLGFFTHLVRRCSIFSLFDCKARVFAFYVFCRFKGFVSGNIVQSVAFPTLTGLKLYVAPSLILYSVVIWKFGIVLYSRVLWKWPLCSAIFHFSYYKIKCSCCYNQPSAGLMNCRKLISSEHLVTSYITQELITKKKAKIETKVNVLVLEYPYAEPYVKWLIT